MNWRCLWAAGRFLTRLPFPDPGVLTPLEQGRTVPFYPLIGLLLGVLFAVVGQLLHGLDSHLAAVVLLILWIWATGAMHVDGLADTADAWVGGLGSRERTLEIMKDPRSGPVAVAVIVVDLLARWVALQLLCAAGQTWVLLLLPWLARGALPLLLLSTPYARTRGIISAHMEHLPRRPVLWSALLSGVGGVLIGGWVGVVLVMSAVVLFVVCRRAMMIRLNGFTGDTAGAMLELSETALLLLAVPMVGAA